MRLHRGLEDLHPFSGDFGGFCFDKTKKISVISLNDHIILNHSLEYEKIKPSSEAAARMPM